MAPTEAAWLAGEVGEAHVEALAGARAAVGGERFSPDEAPLVVQARALGHRDFLRTLAYWVQAVDGDGAEEAASAQHEARTG